MGKYEPLTDFLKKQAAREIRLSFEQIERIIGTKLPASAREYRGWWSNNPNNSVMTKAWLEAGFRSEQVDMKSRKLVLRRVAKAGDIGKPGEDKRAIVPGRHPAYGWLKGTVTIAPGVDLTEPAEPHWGEVAYGDKTWDDFE